mgnify:CR=1 FL=1
MKTEFLVEYELYDTTAIRDAVESSGTNAPFGDLALLKEKREVPRYATLEQNFFVLDGTAEEMPDAPEDIAYFSTAQAGADGRFADPPILWIDFTEKHTSAGITLYFEENWPLKIEVSWYDLDGLQKERAVFEPDGPVYFCNRQVEEYGHLKIVFQEALPYHNIKLGHIRYGLTKIWGSDTIKTGKLVSDTDPVSNQIKTDKLTFDFVDVHDDFNIGNLNGIHKAFQKKQRMLPYEIVDGKRILLGAFFLDDNSTTKNISRISAVDYKGILSNADFRDGRIYEGESAGKIIDEIMAAAGITDYTVDTETYNTPVYGTLKIQTCQKALREVLFACGAAVETSRRTDMYIHKAGRKVSSVIPRSRKFSTTLKTDHYVSDVNVKYKTWELEEKESQIMKGVYDPGIHTIQLSSPAIGMTASVGRIVKQMPYYVVLEVDGDEKAEVCITGRKYKGEELAALSSVKHVRSGEIRSVKTFTGTLLDYGLAQKAAENILEYYQLQQIIQTKHIGAEERAGDWVEIENTVAGHGNFTACMESLTIDLTSGFIGTAKYRGYYKLVSDYYRIGEIYAGEETGII